MSDLTADDTKPAVDAAYEAFKTWSKTPAKVCPFCVFVLDEISSHMDLNSCLILGLLSLKAYKAYCFGRRMHFNAFIMTVEPLYSVILPHSNSRQV